MTEKKRPTLYECQFITMSEVLTGDQYELVSTMITNDFTWGDTDVVLVKSEKMREVLDQRMKRLLRDLPRDPDAQEAINAMIQAMDEMGDSTYVNLY